ncbi:hypothetical protein FHETE_2080 [Fusarium heterosporum]|uniref:Uncharacterized protein n=1 Tax=Fusarium heterosporum TaxID=42747 RepID=A0A8H5TQM2_FUSHE|nr:hypothetical protein FHETE_2080 [Fusarium heterosporum]
MPSSIPYDPSLALMSVVSEEALDNMSEIAALQATVDAAQDALNSLISSKRSLIMTKAELQNLGTPTDQLDKELDEVNAAVEKAAGDYAKARMTAEPQIMEKRKNIRSFHKQIENPMDHLRSQIKKMPLANDAMNMDVQYFSFDTKSQNSASYSAEIASYVSGTTGGIFGAQKSMEIGAAVARQVNQQLSEHNIEGTVVLSVTCTHKNAEIVAPLILNVDKAIKAWNHFFPESKLDTTSGSSMIKGAIDESLEDKQKFYIISGTTFGSIFVGMVHILNTTNTSASESMTEAAESLEVSIDMSSWCASKSGKFGVDSKFVSDFKNLFGQQNVQSHVTVLTMGVTPSIMASEVSRTIGSLAKFDPEPHVGAVEKTQNAVASEEASVQSLAKNARTSGQASGLGGTHIEPLASVLDVIGNDKTKVLDVNSMMTALEDYLKKATEGVTGVPINYYLKDIDQNMLAQIWLAKYYPGQ